MLLLPLIFIAAIITFANTLPKDKTESKWRQHEKQQIISKIDYNHE